MTKQLHPLFFLLIVLPPPAICGTCSFFNVLSMDRRGIVAKCIFLQNTLPNEAFVFNWGKKKNIVNEHQTRPSNNGLSMDRYFGRIIDVFFRSSQALGQREKKNQPHVRIGRGGMSQCKFTTTRTKTMERE